jgi:uncharacterized repeat protein (TIGR01451 family)
MKRYLLRIALLTFSLLLLFGSSAFTTTAQGTSDLSVTIVANRDKVKLGQMITYTVTATNLGPDAASLFDVTHSLPDQLLFVSLTCDRGVNNDGDLCEYSGLNPGASVVSKLVATPLLGIGLTRVKKVATTAIVNLETQDTVDLDASNNTATIAVRLIGRQSQH